MTKLSFDIVTLLLSALTLMLVWASGIFDFIVLIVIFGSYGLIILLNTITIILHLTDNAEGALRKRLNIFGMVISYLPIVGLAFGEIVAAGAPAFFNWNVIPFGYYLLLSFLVFLVAVATMAKVEGSIAMVIAVPILLVSFGTKLLVALYDLFFPSRFRDFMPYLDVTRMMFLSLTEIMADEERLETEKALAQLGNTQEQVDEIAAGYHIRKGIGQGIDYGITAVVFAFFGVLAFLTGDLGIPPQVVVLLFSSVGLAFATFAGFFGPFYGLFEACKLFALRHGNYRAATIYRSIEQLFSIPFNVVAAGFLLIDLPPVDAESLEDFKGEMQEQLTEITENISSLLGQDKGDIPQRTRRMISEVLGSTQQSLADLDFREMREETAREFALIYYQHEFSIKPWARKSAVEEFAQINHFDVLNGEENLKLIGAKIKAGQMTDDMVNNIMISAALRGVIQMEQKHQETLQELELGQTCTGLAFGARQFLKDHYVVKTQSQQIGSFLKNVFVGFFAIPLVIVLSYHRYANRFYDELAKVVKEYFIQGRAKEIYLLRTTEVYTNLRKLLSGEGLPKPPKEEVEEVKERRSINILTSLRKMVKLIWDVVVFPFMLIYYIIRWVYKRVFIREPNRRDDFEKAISHAALVSMYDELFKRLVMQTHVSSAY